VEVQHGVEARLCPRFKLDANLKIHSGTGELLSGYVLEISESGISAMLPLKCRWAKLWNWISSCRWVR
jgi:hypothetical protein